MASSKRKQPPDTYLAQLEAAYADGYWGDSNWQDLPTESGFYWFRIPPSIAVRGPARVIRMQGELLGQVFDSESGGGFKPVESFRREWSGPLARPTEPDKEVAGG